MKQVDFEIVAGDSRTLTVHVTNADGTDTNLANAEIVWTARRSVALQADTYIIKNSANTSQILIEVPAQGIFSVDIGPEDTDTIPTGVYDHQARVTEYNGTVTTIIGGSMTVLNRITDVDDDV